jgi:Sporulation and spore germination
MSGGPTAMAEETKTARPRRLPGRLLLAGLALLLALSCRGAAQTGAGAQGAGGAATGAGTHAPRPSAGDVVTRVKVFLIAPSDGGRTGRKVACGDSAQAIEVAAAQPAPALAAALGELLAMHQPSDHDSGLLNPLYDARLQLAGIDRRGGEITVRLTGYVERGTPCDNQRMLAQLTETAMQFADVSYVRFDVDGHPLRDLLADAPAAAPQP